jgi:hypothetical protein
MAIKMFPIDSPAKATDAVTSFSPIIAVGQSSGQERATLKTDLATSFGSRFPGGVDDK